MTDDGIPVEPVDDLVWASFDGYREISYKASRKIISVIGKLVIILYNKSILTLEEVKTILED